MGSRGPKPLPTAIKQARGTYRANRAATNEPQAQGVPTAPAWLSSDEKKEFRRLTKELQAMGVVGRVDTSALARYSRLWWRWRQAEAAIDKMGSVIPIMDRNPGPDGKPKVKYLQQNPYIGIARSLSEQLDRIENAYGMNAASRSRIDVTPPPPPDDDLDAKAAFLDGLDGGM